MHRIITIIMYVLWIAVIVAILTTTFTRFQYEDLNLIAILLLAFSILNSIFVAAQK